MNLFILSAAVGYFFSLLAHTVHPRRRGPYLLLNLRRLADAHSEPRFNWLITSLISGIGLALLIYFAAHGRIHGPFDESYVPTPSAIERMLVGLLFGTILFRFIADLYLNQSSPQTDQSLPMRQKVRGLLMAGLVLLGGLGEQLGAWTARMTGFKIGPNGAEFSFADLAKCNITPSQVSDPVTAHVDSGMGLRTTRNSALNGLYSIGRDFDEKRLAQLKVLSASPAIPEDSKTIDKLKESLGGIKTEQLIGNYVTPIASCGIILDRYFPNYSDQQSAFSGLADNMRQLSASPKELWQFVPEDFSRSLYQLTWIVVNAAPLLEPRVQRDGENAQDLLAHCLKVVRLTCLPLQEPSAGNANTASFATDMTSCSKLKRTQRKAGSDEAKAPSPMVDDFAKFRDVHSDSRPYLARTIAWLLAASGDWMGAATEIEHWLSKHKAETGSNNSLLSVVQNWHIMQTRIDLINMLEPIVQANPSNVRLRRYHRNNLTKLLDVFRSTNVDQKGLGMASLRRDAITGLYDRDDDPCEIKLPDAVERVAAVRLALLLFSIENNFVFHTLQLADPVLVTDDIKAMIRRQERTSLRCFEELSKSEEIKKEIAMYRAYTVYHSARLDLHNARARARMMEDREAKQAVDHISEKANLAIRLVRSYKDAADARIKTDPFPQSLVASDVDEIYYAAERLQVQLAQFKREAGLH